MGAQGNSGKVWGEKNIKRFIKWIWISVIILLVLIFVYQSNSSSVFKKKHKAEISSIDTIEDINKSDSTGEIVQNEQNSDGNISTAVAQARTINSDSSNIWWLSCAIYNEGENLSDEAQIAIASIVLNRVNSPNFPNNIFEVLVQPGQYSFVNDEIIDGNPDDRALSNATYVYQNGSQIPEKVVYQSMFEQGSGIWKVIDGEYFCYE